MSNDQLLEAVRFAAWALGFSVGTVAIHYAAAARRAGGYRWRDLLQPSSSLHDHGYRLGEYGKGRVALGLAAMTYGWALHQAYWWVWQVAISRQFVELKGALEAAALCTTAAYVMMYVGCGLMISPYTQRVAGRWWLAMSAGVVVGLLGIGAGMSAI